MKLEIDKLMKKKDIKYTIELVVSLLCDKWIFLIFTFAAIFSITYSSNIFLKANRNIFEEVSDT